MPACSAAATSSAITSRRPDRHPRDAAGRDARGHATTQARDHLLDAGFDNVTLVIAGRAGEMGKIIPPVPAAAA